MNTQNPREVYGRTLAELGEENPRIIVLEADLGKSTMTCYFEAAFPDRFFEMGIAEANMTSFAAGLSLTGKVPFTNSFAVFAAGRAYDQIRQSICVPQLNVKIVGSSAGLSDCGDGATHQSVEDVAIMRALPNMTVLVPADGNETRAMTRTLARHEGPAYLRIGREDMVDVLPPDCEVVIGRPVLLRAGNDAVVFANGVMVARALEAAETLSARGVSVRVVNVSSLKPVDADALRAHAQGMRAVVTAEEHSLIGGLASLMGDVLHGSGVPFETVGIADQFGQSAGTYDELLTAYHLTSGDIVAAVEKALH